MSHGGSGSWFSPALRVERARSGALCGVRFTGLGLFGLGVPAIHEWLSEHESAATSARFSSLGALLSSISSHDHTDQRSSSSTNGPPEPERRSPLRWSACIALGGEESAGVRTGVGRDKMCGEWSVCAEGRWCSTLFGISIKGDWLRAGA
eukprot:3878515-Rhodomonas_salina.1